MGEEAAPTSMDAKREASEPAPKAPIAPDTQIREPEPPRSAPDIAAGPGLFDDNSEKENETMDIRVEIAQRKTTPFPHWHIGNSITVAPKDIVNMPELDGQTIEKVAMISSHTGLRIKEYKRLGNHISNFIHRSRFGSIRRHCSTVRIYIS